MEWKPYLDRFEISDTGVCRKIKSKLPYTVRLNNGSPTVNYRVGEKHEAFNLAQVVYHLFVDSEYKGHLYHKDGDKLNCAVENLIPSITGKREPWQVEQFEKYGYPSIKWFVGKYAVMQFFGTDTTDDFIQECAWLIWKHLPKLKGGEKFVSFAYKYCAWTFIRMKRQQARRHNAEVTFSNYYRGI